VYRETRETIPGSIIDDMRFVAIAVIAAVLTALALAVALAVTLALALALALALVLALAKLAVVSNPLAAAAAYT
jgi:hypothetical protein